jgi:AAA family ATP:ADP antiporter
VGRLAARVDQARLLRGILALLGAMLLPLWVMVVAHVTSAFVLLVIVAKQLDAIAVLVFWTMLGGLVSGRQGKRLFGLVNAGGTLGTICGSFTSAPLGRTLGMAALLPLATVLLGLGALATWPLRRWQAPRARRVAAPRREESDVRRFWSLWQGWLFRLLVVSSLLAGVSGRCSTSSSPTSPTWRRARPGRQRLLDLYGVIRGWINVSV